jgi:hypothetical protein
MFGKIYLALVFMLNIHHFNRLKRPTTHTVTAGSILSQLEGKPEAIIKSLQWVNDW